MRGASWLLNHWSFLYLLASEVPVAWMAFSCLLALLSASFLNAAWICLTGLKQRINLSQTSNASSFVTLGHVLNYRRKGLLSSCRLLPHHWTSGLVIFHSDVYCSHPVRDVRRPCSLYNFILLAICFGFVFTMLHVNLRVLCMSGQCSQLSLLLS